jgi:hypothetical protein
LKSVEDFTEFEQRGAYFDGDPVMATKKGVNVLERGMLSDNCISPTTTTTSPHRSERG